MIDRMRDAWRVLRGQAKAVPVEATWYTVSTSTWPIAPTSVTVGGTFAVHNSSFG